MTINGYFVVRVDRGPSNFSPAFSVACQCDNNNGKKYKYMCIIANRLYTESTPNANPTAKLHAIVSIQLNIVSHVRVLRKLSV